MAPLKIELSARLMSIDCAQDPQRRDAHWAQVTVAVPTVVRDREHCLVQSTIGVTFEVKGRKEAERWFSAIRRKEWLKVTIEGEQKCSP